MNFREGLFTGKMARFDRIILSKGYYGNNSEVAAILYHFCKGVKYGVAPVFRSSSKLYHWYNCQNLTMTSGTIFPDE